MTQRETLQLEDGRRIGYVEYGDPRGAPAIYLHGTPSSAREAQWMHESAVAHQVRLLSFDRPGYNQSDPAVVPEVGSAASAVVAATRSLGLERFAVVGFSGGAGCALSVAAQVPESASIVHVGGGMGPYTDGAKDVLPLSRRVPFRVIARSPRAANLLLGLMSRQMCKSLGKKLDIPTLAALDLLQGAARGAQRGAAETYVRSTAPEELGSWVTEYMDGSRAIAAVRADISSLSRPWSFDLRTMQTPVELWHGTDDGAVPIAYAQALARALPNVELHTLEGEGHFVFLTHADEVCASIRAHS